MYFTLGEPGTFCQITLPSSFDSNASEENAGKWNKNRIEYSLDPHKILVSKNYIFTACRKSLLIHDCRKSVKPLIEEIEISIPIKTEQILTYHKSNITVMNFDEASGVLCSCSEESIFILRWDSILGRWDEIRISEGEGRVMDCSVTSYNKSIIATVFKNDCIIIYQAIALHSLSEPGPLILETIDCLGVFDKLREPTSYSKSFIIESTLKIVSVSSGNAVSLKLWEMRLESKTIKLVDQQTIRNSKSVANCDTEKLEDFWFVIVMGNEGNAEVFIIQGSNFVLLNRIKIEDQPEDLDISKLSSNSLGPQAEFRVLNAKFFFHNEPKSENFLKTPVVVKSESINDFNHGDGPPLLHPVEDLNNSFAEASEESRRICPNLMIIVATTKGISLVDVKSGESDTMFGYDVLLRDDSILVNNAKIAVNDMQIILALQPCLSRVMFCRKFAFVLKTQELEIESESTYSLISQEILNPKSVLRKRIKSPPPSKDPARLSKGRRVSGSRSKFFAPKPAWARSRSRPLSNSSSKGSIRSTPAMSARSHKTNPPDFLQHPESLMSSRPTRIQVRGSYSEESLNFREPQRINLNTRLSDGLSYMRLATNRDGKLLAVGANTSPLIILKTQPFENIKLLKDLARVTSLSFSFNSDLLLVASNDGKTTMIQWQTSKQLLSFDFNSKFNEHLHSQFYFMDKFILQPEENQLVLYSYAKRDLGFIKLQAGCFPMQCQNITAVAAANQFYSNKIIAGLSNKSIQVFDTNAEKVGLTINQAHTKPVSCIRINEAPKATRATELCDFFLTSSYSNVDPMKLWDLRSAKCILRISDVNSEAFVPTSRPSLSPCGRYIASGYEDNSLTLYDVRKINTRLMTFKGIKSSILDSCFDYNFPMVWCGCRNGTFWNFYTQ